MKFTIKVKNEQTTWEETYTENIPEDEIDMWASDLIANFNRSLRTGETKREYLGYSIVDETLIKHDWEKTNCYTQFTKKGQQYDTFRCVNCGVTGKRFTLGGEIVLDPPFDRAKKYKHCNWKDKVCH